MERLAILCIALAIAGCEASSYKDAYARINSKLSTALPLAGSGPLEVDVAWQVLSIDSVDKANNRVDFVVSKRAFWYDGDLSWNPRREGFTSIFVDAGKIWTPDVAVYNAGAAEKIIQPEVVLVLSDGSIVSSESSRISALCDVSNVDSYSGATCEIVLGSWAYRNDLFTLKEPTEDISFFTASYSSSSKYEIITYDIRKEQRNYACCKYETKYSQDVWVINVSFREKAGTSKSIKLSTLKALLN